MDKNRMDSGYRYGSLPGSAPLAMGYVPLQVSASPSYETDEALARGTLFPGLDLPFMNIVNDKAESTPMTELMAIDFVTDELALYLDTHADDMEAFQMYQTFLALCEEARKRYTKKYGPVTRSDMLGMNTYKWVESPWPWEYCGKRED